MSDDSDSHLEDDYTVIEITAPKLKRIKFSSRPIRSNYIGNSLNSLELAEFNFNYPLAFTTFQKTKETIAIGGLLRTSTTRFSD